jgi:hypothetical protein
MITTQKQKVMLVADSTAGRQMIWLCQHDTHMHLANRKPPGLQQNTEHAAKHLSQILMLFSSASLLSCDTAGAT